MDELQFGSLHKLRVSLGIVLVAAPFFLFAVSLLSEPSLISQEEYDGLSGYSQKILTMKEDGLQFVSNWGFLAALASIAIGILFIAWGMKPWRKLQESLDKQEQQKANEAELRVKLLNDSAVSEKERKSYIANELMEEFETKTFESGTCAADVTGGSDNSIRAAEKVPGAGNQDSGEEYKNIALKKDSGSGSSNECKIDSIVQKHYDVEAACSESVRQYLGSEYEIVNGVRTQDGILDFVAVSQSSSPDLLFEVKYNQGGVNYAVLENAALKLFLQSVNYQQTFNKNCQCILIAVCSHDECGVEMVKSRFDNFIERQSFLSEKLQAVFVEYNNLASVGESVKKQIAHFASNGTGIH